MLRTYDFRLGSQRQTYNKRVLARYLEADDPALISSCTEKREHTLVRQGGAATRVKLKWGADGVLVTLYAERHIVATLNCFREKVKDQHCLGDIEKLKAAGRVAEDFWAVFYVEVPEEFRGKGFGKAVYIAAFKAIRDKHGAFYTGPAVCTGSAGTTASAMRVWTSLKSKYPSAGDVLYIE